VRSYACGLSCGQASLRSGPSPGRPELGRPGGGLRHAGRYPSRRSRPSLGLPKSRRTLPAPRPIDLHHRGARIAAHAAHPIAPSIANAHGTLFRLWLIGLQHCGTASTRTGLSPFITQRTVAYRSPPRPRPKLSQVSGERQAPLDRPYAIRLRTRTQRRARNATRSSVRHLRSRTERRRGGSPPERFRQAQREAGPPDSPERPACLRLREQPSSGRSGGTLRAQGSPANGRTAAV
jgi:hypothetical protein